MTAIKRKIHVIGINSFDFHELPLKMQSLFLNTVNIAVPESYFNKIKLWANKKTPQKNFFASKSDKKLITWLSSQQEDVILISRGDPLWFGIGRILLENFSREELFFYPSNTVLQLAFSKLKIPWQDCAFVSIHGRNSTNFTKSLKAKPATLAIITDSKNKSLEVIQKNLLELKLDDYYDFWVCEEIGFKNEKIRELNVYKELPSDISKLNIAVLIKRKSIKEKDDIPLFGIEDETFKTFEDRPNLLTKREVRVQILADLELPKKGTIWDIGAGCGSIGLEALKLRPNLDLFCIDKRIGSKKLILENAKSLGVKPKDIFEENINNLLEMKNHNHLNKANRVIIGGCNKKTKLLLINVFSQTMKIGDIIVIPIIDIESLKELKGQLNDKKFKTSLNLIQTYKSLSISEGIRLDPNNPVFLLKGKK